MTNDHNIDSRNWDGGACNSNSSRHNRSLSCDSCIATSSTARNGSVHARPRTP